MHTYIHTYILLDLFVEAVADRSGVHRSLVHPSVMQRQSSLGARSLARSLDTSRTVRLKQEVVS